MLGVWIFADLLTVYVFSDLFSSFHFPLAGRRDSRQLFLSVNRIARVRLIHLLGLLQLVTRVRARDTRDIVLCDSPQVLSIAPRERKAEGRPRLFGFWSEERGQVDLLDGSRVVMSRSIALPTEPRYPSMGSARDAWQSYRGGLQRLLSSSTTTTT